jgi:subtilisin family serine protease
MVKCCGGFCFLICYLMSMGVFAQSQISPRLAAALQDASVSGQSLRVLVMLRDQVDIYALDQSLYAKNALPQERAQRVIHNLKEKAKATQRDLVQFLESIDESRGKLLERYWISNMVLLEARADVIWLLANRRDLLYMDIDAKLEFDRPVAEGPAAPATPNSAEPGLKAINAHKLWALGYTGAGRIVMGIDTGVDGNHPALSYKWRGNHVPAEQAWFDTEGGTSFPNDCDSHGSHTVGTMCGLDPATNDTIGVAPDAEWIAAKTICSGNHTSRSISAFQWAMDPDGDSTTIEDMPDAIGNSWYDPSVSVCSPVYASVFDAVEAAGIAIVFSAGNSGPGSQSITTPKNINTGLVNTFATGAVNGNDASLPIASFSSRGPSQCGGTGSIAIKPEASAPGVSVRSAVLNGGYGTKSGTSMACPHVVGAIALLKQAFPNKTGHELKMALYLTAKETPADVTPGEDNVYGMGVIDVYEAFLSLGAPETPLSFKAYSDYRTPHAMHLTWEDPSSFTNGDTLLTEDFHIHIYREGTKIDSVTGGVGEYWDNGLTDGELYRYTIFAKLDTANIASGEAFAEWIAGGAKQPQPPAQFTVAGNDTLTRFFWINPTKNIDNTPMDDFAGISLYRDSSLVETFARASTDTGRVDTVFYMPDPPGLYQWFVTAVDNETPQNESVATMSIGTPLSLPIIEEFATAGVPSPVLWQNQNTEVNDRADSPPSGQYSINLNGTPNGEDVVTLQPVDLSVVSANTVFSYFYQPQGIGNAPETGDSLRVYFKNDLNEWVLVRSYAGTTVQPFQKEIIRLTDESAGSGTFFHSQFQVRFRTTGGAGPFPNDDWFIDDIFLGIEQPLGINDLPDDIPNHFEILANYPNPFNPSTTIRYRLPVRSEVSFVVFNALGQEVKRLISEQREAGNHQIVWYGDNSNGTPVASGIYFYLFTAKSLSGNGEVFRATQKMTLIK